MIGSDEFNVRKLQSISQQTSDSSDMDFIETFYAASNKDQIDSGFLIDIVCPQPRSQRGRGIRGKNNHATEKNTKSGRK